MLTTHKHRNTQSDSSQRQDWSQVDRQEEIALGDEEQVVVTRPLGATLLLPVEIVEPLGATLLLRPRAHVLGDPRP